MNANLAEKLKSLRKEKNISQEKLAQYLNVSFNLLANGKMATPVQIFRCYLL